MNNLFLTGPYYASTGNDYESVKSSFRVKAAMSQIDQLNGESQRP